MNLEFGFGIPQSKIDEITEIEHHLHNLERWMGAAAVPSGETHVADNIGDTTAAFQIDAGNLTWGLWVQILGSADTPIQSGKTYFDLHRIQISAVERVNAIHFVQIAFGTSGAAGFAAGSYTEFVFEPTVTQGRVAPIDLIDARRPAGTKAWARVLVVGQNTGTMDFFIGIHEYDA